jgi:hypothetical protein
MPEEQQNDNYRNRDTEQPEKNCGHSRLRWCYGPGSRELMQRRSIGAAINTTLALAPVTVFCGWQPVHGNQRSALDRKERLNDQRRPGDGNRMRANDLCHGSIDLRQAREGIDTSEPEAPSRTSRTSPRREADTQGVISKLIGVNDWLARLQKLTSGAALCQTS